MAMRDQKFLGVTFCLIMLLGGPAVLSVMQEPLDAVSPVAAISRIPASISSQSRNRITSKSVVLDVSCTHLQALTEVDGSLLRLRGSGCMKENSQEMKIINETNGFTAAIIPLKERKFTTDFIELKEGLNQLKISLKDDKGQTVIQTFSVRRLPASNL